MNSQETNRHNTIRELDKVTHYPHHCSKYEQDISEHQEYWRPCWEGQKSGPVDCYSATVMAP